MDSKMMKYQNIIPAILSRSLNRLFNSKTEARSPKLFLTYADAQKSGYGAGYEDFELVETVFEKTKLVKDQMLSRKFPLSDSATQSLLAILFALQHHVETQKQIKVIDFGGACGAHYFQLRPFLPPDVQASWIVVETPAMVEKAKTLETSELHFVASMLAAKEMLQSVDLLHSSGALQYVPDPEATIQEFTACQSTYIFLNRLALSSSEIFITIQESLLSANGPGALPYGLTDKICRYPVTYFPKRHLIEMVSQNYQTIIEFADTKMAVAQKEIFVNTGLFTERFQ